jgi:hypothetical protein
VLERIHERGKAGDTDVRKGNRCLLTGTRFSIRVAAPPAPTTRELGHRSAITEEADEGRHGTLRSKPESSYGARRFRPRRGAARSELTNPSIQILSSKNRARRRDQRQHSK